MAVGEMKADLISSVLDAIQNPGDRLRAWTVLDGVRGKTIYIPLRSHADKIEHARSLLADGFSPRDAVRALQNKFDCSQRTAQRAVNSARQKS